MLKRKPYFSQGCNKSPLVTICFFTLFLVCIQTISFQVASAEAINSTASQKSEEKPLNKNKQITTEADQHSSLEKNKSITKNDFFSNETVEIKKYTNEGQSSSYINALQKTAPINNPDCGKECENQDLKFGYVSFSEGLDYSVELIGALCGILAIIGAIIGIFLQEFLKRLHEKFENKQKIEMEEQHKKLSQLSRIDSDLKAASILNKNAFLHYQSYRKIKVNRSERSVASKNGPLLHMQERLQIEMAIEIAEMARNQLKYAITEMTAWSDGAAPEQQVRSRDIMNAQLICNLIFYKLSLLQCSAKYEKSSTMDERYEYLRNEIKYLVGESKRPLMIYRKGQHYGWHSLKESSVRGTYLGHIKELTTEKEFEKRIIAPLRDVFGYSQAEEKWVLEMKREWLNDVLLEHSKHFWPSEWSV